MTFDFHALAECRRRAAGDGASHHRGGRRDSAEVCVECPLLFLTRSSEPFDVNY